MQPEQEKYTPEERGEFKAGELFQGNCMKNQLPPLALLRRPYGAPRIFIHLLPAFKRWANQHCAYGAKK